MTPTPTQSVKIQLLDAIIPHVAFDGWAPAAFDAAIVDSGVDPALARSLCPRGAIDLAIAFHEQGDQAMVAALHAADLTHMRFRDKVAHAIRLRITAIPDKEAVRRGTALFALPHMAGDGARLIWGTADQIWTALGDTSEDANWYTKRLTLSGVYASVVLYWLGDDSTGGQATDAFIDRRIEDVMQVEKVKARLRDNLVLKPLTLPFGRLMAGIKAPRRNIDPDLPGIWRDPT
jgi:ubiquinone biosynthesis protein COQ9